MKVFIVNSFAKIKTGGNPAGVVLGADRFSDSEMQRIAKKVSLHETAFVMKSDKADFKVRFFTPDVEVPFCGHAAIAVFNTLRQEGIIKQGKYRQETNTGILDVNVAEGNIIFMDQKLPEFLDIIGKNVISDCLNISNKELMPYLPTQIVSTGFPSIIVPIKSLETMKNMKPDFEECKKLSGNKFLIHPFTSETIQKNSTAFSRNFFPIEKLDEEAATGSSTGALASYLFKYNLLRKNIYTNLIFEQGNFMNRPSEILVKLKIENSEIQKVQVGGIAMPDKEIEVFIR